MPRRQSSRPYRTALAFALPALVVLKVVNNILGFGALLSVPESGTRAQLGQFGQALFIENISSADPFGTNRNSRGTADEKNNNKALLPVRYDEAGWFETMTIARSHWLPSIPDARSIPRAMTENLPYHIQQRTNTTTQKLKLVIGSEGSRKSPNPAHDLSQDFRTLYLYNPSIVPVLGEEKILAQLPTSSEFFSKESIHYIATFRAYLGSNCFGPSKERPLMKGGEQINYLGIALMNKHLDIIDDIVVDLNEGPLPEQLSYYWKEFSQPTEDCRIFNVRQSLQLVCNNILFGIRLQDAFQENVGTRTEPFHVYPNVYGNSFELALTNQPRLLVEGKEAKNMNIFRARSSNNATSTDEDYYLQIYPLLHWYRALDFHSPAVRAPSDILPPPSFETPDRDRTIRASLWSLGRGSNTTSADQPFFANTNDRGTACCIEVTMGNSTVVLVGISHTKLSGGRRNSFWEKDEFHRYDNATYSYGWNRYLSRFIAYESTFPFAVVARSGWFCLPFASSTEHDHADGNPLAGYNEQYRLDLFEDSFACPAIHFPSTISETSNDPSKAIIGYGINDCYPRIIVVDKLEIAQKLRPRDFSR